MTGGATHSGRPAAMGRMLLAVGAVVLGLSPLVGCGPWEPEPATPVVYRVPPPEPLSPAELAAARAGAGAEGQALAEGKELAIGAAADEYADTDPSALTEFRPVLEPYGTWTDDPTYGTLWVPREDVVGADFVPYVTAGHWTYSDTTSWVWVSDYDWGWAPFHYGRWVRLAGRGWAWIPGRTYAGAWVTWRTGPVGYGYVGWAPMAPSWYWYGGVAVGWGFGWYAPPYVYCSPAYLYHPGLHAHVVHTGPAHREIEARTHPYTPPPGSDRVVAQPRVGGTDRVAAQPGVGGRAEASPHVAGPSPAELGGNVPVAEPPADHRGLARAATLARPSSAVAAGAAPPVQLRPRPVEAVVGSPGASPTVQGRMPRTNIPSWVEPSTRAPQLQGATPTPPRQVLPDTRPGYSAYDAARPRAYDAPRLSTPSSPGGAAAYGSAPRLSGPPIGSVVPSSPSYRPAPSSPAYRPSPGVSGYGSAPRVSAPPMTSPSPSFRAAPSSPSFRSTPRITPAPSFRPSPSLRSAPSVPAPTFRPSPSIQSSPRSGGVMRSAPSVGGIRRR